MFFNQTISEDRGKVFLRRPFLYPGWPSLFQLHWRHRVVVLSLVGKSGKCQRGKLDFKHSAVSLLKGSPQKFSFLLQMFVVFHGIWITSKCCSLRFGHQCPETNTRIIAHVVWQVLELSWFYFQGAKTTRKLRWMSFTQESWLPWKNVRQTLNSSEIKLFYDCTTFAHTCLLQSRVVVRSVSTCQNFVFLYEDLSFNSETGHDQNPQRLLCNETNLYPCRL